MFNDNSSFSRARIKIMLLSIGGAFMVLLTIFIVFAGLKYLYEYRLSQMSFAQEMMRLHTLPMSELISPRGLSPRRDGARFDGQGPRESLGLIFLDSSGIQGFRIPERLQDRSLGVLLSQGVESSNTLVNVLISRGYFVDVIHYIEGDFVYFSRSSYALEDVGRDALYFLLIALVSLLPLGILSYFLTRRILRPLESALESMQEFVSDAGHELKTPLSSVLLELDLLERFVGESEESRSIRARLRQSATLIDTLGDLSLLSYHQKVRVHTPISEMFSDVSAQLSSMIADRGISFETHNLDWSIPIPREQGYLLIKNLIQNAIKYSPKNASIEIKLTSDVLSIRDHGIGMDRETQDRMFDRFYRKNRNDSEGSGIGLAIVEKIAKIYSIRLSVSSKLGEGTEIALHFPSRSCLPPSSHS